MGLVNISGNPDCEWHEMPGGTWSISVPREFLPQREYVRILREQRLVPLPCHLTVMLVQITRLPAFLGMGPWRVKRPRVGSQSSEHKVSSPPQRFAGCLLIDSEVSTRYTNVFSLSLPRRGDRHMDNILGARVQLGTCTAGAQGKG